MSPLRVRRVLAAYHFIMLQIQNSKIGLIDNDLIYRKNHNFPNLALMKISAYLKSKNNNVELVSFDAIGGLFDYDLYIVSKVFTDTFTPEIVFSSNKIIYGGSGFYYDKAEILPFEIEHIMPDYDLYKNAYNLITKGKDHFFKNHSIGFMTRGCIRKCEFCINRNYSKVYKHSELNEFYDIEKPYITLLDDNITAYKDFEKVIIELRETGKPFTFKQGMDFRLLNKERMELLATCKLYGKTDKNTLRTFYFAFDNYSDKETIEKKLIMWNEIFPRTTMKVFYVFCGFKRDRYIDFYEDDYFELIERIKILLKYKAKPYIMRYELCIGHKYEYKISVLAQFCNYILRLGNNSLKKYCIANNINTEMFSNEELELEYKY